MSYCSHSVLDLHVGSALVYVFPPRPCRYLPKLTAVTPAIAYSRLAIFFSPALEIAPVVNLVPLPSASAGDCSLEHLSKKLCTAVGPVDDLAWGQCACVSTLLQTGKCLLEKQIHEKHIMDLQMSTDLTHFVTASNDRSAKLVDTQVSVFAGLFYSYTAATMLLWGLGLAWHKGCPRRLAAVWRHSFCA